MGNGKESHVRGYGLRTTDSQGFDTWAHGNGTFIGILYGILVVGFKHGFYFPFHIWDNPSRLIFFKMVKTTNQYKQM
jgi:hypothetical protein